MKTELSVISVAALLGVMAMAPAAHASSHREALAIVNDPCVDNTDLYAWVTPGTHDRLYLIAGYNGLHEPGQGNQQTRLCDDVLYEFHIAKGVNDLEDDITYQIRFSSTPPHADPKGQPCADITNCGNELLIQQSGVVQTYSVTKVENGVSTVIGQGLPVTPPNVGPQTDRLVYRLGEFKPYSSTSPDSSSRAVGLYDDAFAASFIRPLGDGGSEGRAWTGTRDDAFYLDEKGIFDIINLAGLEGIGGRSTPGEDVFAGFNLNVIALEIPTRALTGSDRPPHNGTPGNDTLIGVWTSASRRRDRRLEPDGSTTSCGPWVQVSREGLPLVNAGLIGVQDQSLYLRTQPKDDVANFGAYFLFPVLVRDLDALGVYRALGLSDDVIDRLKRGPDGQGRFDILDAINLRNFPTAGAHNVPLSATGDVLRVDLAIDSQFPNGRMIPGGATPDREQVDVSDVLLTVIASPDPANVPLGDGVNHNDKNYLSEFPWHAAPHQGLDGGHGAPAL
jgi:hypothetical protein